MFEIRAIYIYIYKLKKEFDRTWKAAEEKGTEEKRN